jgi:hypothetical protein
MNHKGNKRLPNQKFKTIKVEDAVGTALAHDITEIRPGEFKGCSFRRGHIVEPKDLCHLMRLGKRHLYALDLQKDQVHEDKAVFELAEALAGPGVIFEQNPKEGKLELTAAVDGLLKVNVETLTDFNLIEDVMCASLHTNTPVTKGQKVAATRAIPLVIERPMLDKAINTACAGAPIFTVKPFKAMKVRLIITGSEVYEGLIEDRFEKLVDQKITGYGALLLDTVILPDDRDLIAEKVTEFLEDGTDLIVTTGGMSVDPDDVTRAAIFDAGMDQLYYGAAVLPGAMFLLAYKGASAIAGIPACGLYHQTTIFDLILPRLLAGERPAERDLACLAHGGLCRDCKVCSYPACSFGKS